MVTLAEMFELEGAVVAVGRGLTAELQHEAGDALLRFESVSGAEAVVHVLAGAGSPVDVLALLPASFDAADELVGAGTHVA